MPKIVDKAQRRKEIANSSRDLLLQKGITSLTVSEVAKNAGIGKGTIYQYFSSKEDIVFAIIDAHIDEELEALDKDLKSLQKFDEKLFRFFEFLLRANENSKELKTYLEYLSIAINCNNEEMIQFNLECRDKFRSRLDAIITQAIEQNEIKPVAKECVFGLYALERGFILLKGTEENIDLEIEMNNFLKAFLTLVKL